MDPLTTAKFNRAYVAHILADSPGGPRYLAGESERLRNDLSNLMLLCDPHHRLVDIDEPGNHSAETLREMKAEHETRVDLLASLGPELQSEVVMYGANIGGLGTGLTFEDAAAGMVPHRFPRSRPGIALGLRNALHTERGPTYWATESDQLRTGFDRWVRPAAVSGVPRFAVFALAPQPLLIQLGALFSDLANVELYQRRREPVPSWKWDDDGSSSVEFQISAPSDGAGPVAVTFEVSATIDHERVHRVLPDARIWSIRVAKPHNDILRSRVQLEAFRVACRQLFARVNLAHPQLERLHVFPAMPVAIAVELGRCRSPKADPPLRIWDEIRSNGGFAEAIDLA